ncbi:hypothetical protein ABZS66_00935 [Dactylosporangium sp. NPDC005572]|uniref:hypothetical protein n=1 Tax=Dactylosporangium sp. NPDC005572 TaxID=3156889 RepID=UPI0033B7B359
MSTAGRDAPFTLLAAMLAWRHLPHRQAALVGQFVAVNAEVSYLLATAREYNLLGDDAWFRHFRDVTRNMFGLAEEWERFAGGFGHDPDPRTADPHDSDLRVAIEAALFGMRARLADVRAELGVTGSGFDFGPPGR